MATSIPILGILGSALYFVAQKTQVSVNFDLRVGHLIGLSMVGIFLYLGYQWNWYSRVTNYITHRRREAATEANNPNIGNNTQISDDRDGEGVTRDFDSPENINHSGENNKYLKYFNRLPAPADGQTIHTPVYANRDIPLDVLPEDMFPKYYLKYQYRSPEKLREIINHENINL